MARKNKQLEKILNEKQAVEAEGRIFNDEVFEKVKEELVKWGGEELRDYNPIVELAKMGNDPSCKDELRARCNMEVASFMYPKVKSYEVKSKEDKTVNVIIHVAQYAQKGATEIEVEEIDDLEDEEDKDPEKIDYTDMVLKQAQKGGKSIN